MQILSLPAFAVITVGLTALYQTGSAWLDRLDLLLSGRLELGSQAMQTYGIRLFGSAFEMVGSGGDTVAREGYNFIDSSYCLILVRYGLVPFAAVCVLFFCGALRGRRQERWLLALTLAALHSISEHHLLEVTYNIFLLTAFAAPDDPPSAEAPSPRLAKGEKAVLGILAFGCAALFPWALDVLRTVVTLLRLNVTGRREWFIAGTLAALVLAGVILRAAHRLWHLPAQAEPRERTRLCAALGGSGILLCAACLYAGSVIRGGMSAYSASLDCGLTVLDLLAEADEADAPAVYVEDVPELYRRRTNLLSRRILSPDTAVDEKAVIITGIGQDYYRLIQSGYQFAELSETEGLYTNDEALIERLNESGLVSLSGAYTVRRTVDLSLLAEQNGLTLNENGSLTLRGAEQSLIHGPYVTVYQGLLRVQYRLHLISAPSAGGRVGTLRVSASCGQKVYQETDIFADDFDENGDAVFTVDTSIQSSEGMEFLVLLDADAAAEVREISYGKIEPSAQ